MLAALTLAAGTAEARCTLSDVKITKAWPAIGNPSRFSPNDQVIIRFQLPSDCAITNPPLEVCAVVWDGSPCDQSLNTDNRCDGDYVGGAGVNLGSGWTEKGRAEFCNAGLLAEHGVFPGQVLNEVNLLISTGRGEDVGSGHHLSIIMYEPARSIVIPIE